MKRVNKSIKKMGEAKIKATVFETRSEMLLKEAYLELVKTAKANGITVEELIAERKKRK